MSEFFRNIGIFIQTTVSDFMFKDLLDIAFVSIIAYFVLKFIRDTRAAQLLRGIVLVLLLWQVASLFKLQATQYILNSTLEFGILAILIVFQPELRAVLERIGRKGTIGKIPLLPHDESDYETQMVKNITAIQDAVSDMSATKTGALIVIERETKLGEIMDTGTRVDAAIVTEVITNIFYPKAPLHDGAMIIRDNRIAAAGCFLPLTTKQVDNGLGTRHRAGIGVSEISDALVILVSEETGIISLAQDGKLQRRLTPDALTGILKKNLLKHDEEGKKSFLSHLWKGRKK